MHSVSSYKYELLLFFFGENKLLDRNSEFALLLILLKMLQTDSNITASNAWFKAGFWMENQLKFSCCGFENSLWSYTVKEAETVNEFLLHNFAILSSGGFFLSRAVKLLLLHLDGWKIVFNVLETNWLFFKIRWRKAIPPHYRSCL